MNTLAQYLRDKNIRQADFAKQCGVTQPVVSRLVCEVAQPGPHLASIIEKVTGGEVRFYHWPAYSHFAPTERSGAAS